MVLRGASVQFPQQGEAHKRDKLAIDLHNLEQLAHIQLGIRFNLFDRLLSQLDARVDLDLDGRILLFLRWQLSNSGLRNRILMVILQVVIDNVLYGFDMHPRRMMLQL